MRPKVSTVITFYIVVLVSAACGIAPFGSPTQSFAESVGSTSTPAPAMPTMEIPATNIPTPVSQLPVVRPSPANYCADPQPLALISRLKTALQTSDGEALASLVSPVHGMEARFFRNGRIVNYDQEQAKFLFVSTYMVDWGAAPGSGLETKGSFHALLVPALLDVLNKSYSLKCNQIEAGGTTYAAAWPYTGIDFYSVYDPGTQANANLDWHTWLLGMQYLDGKPYLYAIMQFQWEP